MKIEAFLVTSAAALALSFTSWSAEAPRAGETASAGKSVERQDEGDWVDARWNKTVLGNFHSSVVALPGGSVAKGLSIRMGNERIVSAVYDTATATLCGVWTDGFLKFDSARYGLVRAPKPDGEVRFLAAGSPAWRGTVRWRGLHVSDARVVLEYIVGKTRVLESPWVERAAGITAVTRTYEISRDSENLLTLSQARAVEITNVDGVKVATVALRDERLRFAVLGNAAELFEENGLLKLRLLATNEILRAKLFYTTDSASALASVVKQSAPAEDLTKLAKASAPRWKPLTTKGQRGFATDGFAIDTLTLPYDNPWKALMFVSGVDFLPDGDAAICTIHGDVWLVSGVDESLQKLTWRRFATGLFQPLGLRVRDGKIYVLGRDQITVLHDENGDGEADFYENFFNNISTSTGGHDYVTCLEQDAAGNFYYVDPKGVQRISADGEIKETLAAGLRNPNGLGVGPGPTITTAPQQGEWTPSSAIFEVRPGAHYGYGGPRANSERPLGYDAPLCWLPHAFDNSSSSQVWVPEGAWGALGGKMLHLLWGRCAMALILRDVVDGQPQGAAVALPGRFLSGPMRGTFSPKDGHLYIAGSTGWQTSAAKDGSLQRVRRTGTVTRTPIAWHAHRNGLKLTFAEPLDRAAAEDPGSYALKQWNYRYAADYGSKDYSSADPGKEGRDEVAVRSAKVLPDGKSVFIETAELRPVMQMEVRYNLPFTTGPSAAGPLYLTLNKLDVAF